MIDIVKINDDDLKDNEIDEVVTRVRAFIVSSKHNMIVGHDPKEGYSLIGGYVEAGQDLKQALANLIYAQSGIVLDGKDTIEPFYQIRQYSRDYKGSGLNRVSDLVYFLVTTEKVPNIKKLKLSAMEESKLTPLEVIRRSLFGGELKKYIETEENQINKIKAKELQMAFDKYKQIYKF